jgi:hypothetical protein
MHRSLPGPPLSEPAILQLLSNNVTVGLGIEEDWQARNAWFDAAWVAIEAGGKLDKEMALALVSSNLERLLLGEERANQDLVAWHGGDIFDMNSKVIAVISNTREQVDIL